MSEKKEKSFEERLKSLKTGCIIFSIIEGFSLVRSVISMMLGKNYISGMIGITISGAMLLMLYFMYKYTLEKNEKGPKYERIFGMLMLVESIILCLTIIYIPIGILFIFLSIGVIKEAKWFKEYIEK